MTSEYFFEEGEHIRKLRGILMSEELVPSGSPFGCKVLVSLELAGRF